MPAFDYQASNQLKQCSCRLLRLMGQENPFQDVQGIGPFVTPLANDTCGMRIWSGDEHSDINGGLNAMNLASRKQLAEPPPAPFVPQGSMCEVT